MSIDELEARFNHLQARTITVELMLRALLTMQIARAKNPMAVIDWFKRGFDSSVDIIEFDLDEERAHQVRRSLRAIFQNNIDSIAARIQVPAQEEAEGKPRQ